MERTNHKILLVPYKKHLSALYESLSQKGCSITAFATDSWISEFNFKSVRAEVMKVIVGYPLFFYSWFNINFQAPRYIRKFSSKIKKIEPTVIVIFDFYHWYFLQAISIRRKNPSIQLVIYSESKRWPKRKASSLILRYFLEQARKHQNLIDKVFVYTEDGRNFLLRYLPSDKIHVLPAPVDVDAFSTLAVKSRLPGDTLRILMNARYSPYKRHEALFQAAVDLLSKGKRLQITLIGRADSGRERVKQLVQKYGLSDVVTFLDPLPMTEIANLYLINDVLVLPSYNEAIGMVVPEAMACGLPTITSDTVGANVYVKEGETGWVFPTGDLKALVSALDQCYDSDELERRGLAARTNVVTHYSVPIIAQHFLELLNKRS
jgi:glycosyltransferase involved in cell wall biosynthesis